MTPLLILLWCHVLANMMSCQAWTATLAAPPPRVPLGSKTGSALVEPPPRTRRTKLVLRAVGCCHPRRHLTKSRWPSIAIIRDNIRQLVEQAAAFSGAEDEARNADRIAQQTEELESLIKQRDALLQK